MGFSKKSLFDGDDENSPLDDLKHFKDVRRFKSLNTLLYAALVLITGKVNLEDFDLKIEDIEGERFKKCSEIFTLAIHPTMRLHQIISYNDFLIIFFYRVVFNKEDRQLFRIIYSKVFDAYAKTTTGAYLCDPNHDLNSAFETHCKALYLDLNLLVSKSDQKKLLDYVSNYTAKISTRMK
jgi:hypothetical protein